MIQIKEEQLRLKNAVFCSCVHQCDKDFFKTLGDESPSAYFELSAYNIEAFDKIDSLTLIYSKKDYTSKQGANLFIMNVFISIIAKNWMI